MPEEKRKINAWIPVSLYNKLESAGYENITQALIKAIEKLTEDHRENTKGYSEDIEGYLQDIAEYKQDIASLTVENDKLKDDLSGYHRIQEGYKEDLSRIQKDLERQNQDIIGYKQDIIRLNEDLDKRPDPVTFAQLHSRYEGLQEIIREKDRSIERLENDLNKAGQREEDLKQMHNNYMLQVQSLINQRALSAPAVSTRKKEQSTKEKKENRPTQKEDIPTPKKATSDAKAEKTMLEKICKNCNQTFFTENPRKETCSNKCRIAFHKRQHKS